MICVVDLNNDDFDNQHRIELEVKILAEQEMPIEKLISYTVQLNARELIKENELIVENSVIKRIDVNRDLVSSNNGRTDISFRVQQEKNSSKWAFKALLFGREEYAVQIILISESAVRNPVFLDTTLTNKAYEHVVYEGFTKINNIPQLGESTQPIIYESFKSQVIHKDINSSTMSFNKEQNVMRVKEFETKAIQTSMLGADFFVSMKVAPEQLKETRDLSIFKVLLDGIGQIEVRPRELRFRVEGDDLESYVSVPFLNALDTSTLFANGRFSTNATLKIEGNRNRDLKITYNNYELDVRYQVGAKMGNLSFIGGRITNNSEYEGNPESIEINHRIASKIQDLVMRFTK